MIRRLRKDPGGGSSSEAAHVAVSRGMADVLTALNDVIDDDAALGRVCADLGKNLPEAASGWATGTVVNECAQIGTPGSALTTTRESGPAASRRPLAVRCVAAAAAAALAAGGTAALPAIGAPGASHDGTDGPAERASYVVKRVSSSLRAAGRSEIAQMTVTAHGSAQSGGTTAMTISNEWSHRDQWRSVTNSPAGRPVDDEGSSNASLYTLVSYPTRTWARRAGLGRPAAPVSGSGSCERVVASLPLLFQPGLPGSGLDASSPLTVAADLRDAVSCGTLAAAGRRRVDGIDAIQLTSDRDSLISETIWVSPGTYLPVRVVVRAAPAKPGFLTADIKWLPLTAQNLAKLTVPIPTGFRHVPLAEAVTPVLHHAAG